MENDDLSECIRLFREWVLNKKESTVKEIQAILEKTPVENVLIWVDYVRHQGIEPHLVYTSYSRETSFRQLEMLSFVKKRLRFQRLSPKELESKFSKIRTVKE